MKVLSVVMDSQVCTDSVCEDFPNANSLLYVKNISITPFQKALKGRAFLKHHLSLAQDKLWYLELQM